jgi:N-acetylmuramic acid 6-phosphate etherase
VTAPTERRNPRTTDIDLLPTEAAIDVILAEDAGAVAAARAVGAQLAAAVDLAVTALRAGKRLHYFGAGASGRLALLDATELTPTSGIDPGRVVAHFPGGVSAFVDSSLDFEDARSLGAGDADGVIAGDVAIGITASGTTPYVAGALSAAAGQGATTILVTCNPVADIAADLVIAIDTGPEAITGSTRLKAGTAVKVALNAFSTALMVRLGRTYSNLMTGMSVTNDKLRRRAVALIAEASGATEDESAAAYAASGHDVATAVVMMLGNVDAEAAARELAAAGSVRAAIDSLGGTR